MSGFPTAQVIDAFKNQFGGEVEFEAEVIGGIQRFSFYLVSPHFNAMPHLKRQDAVWEIIDSVLSRDEALQVSAILPLAPGEIESLVK